MFMLNTAGAMLNASVPDVCKTPVGPAVVPMPYPNIGMSVQANPGAIVDNVLLVAMPALNIGTTILMTNGDQAGVLLGVASNMIMGEASFVTSSLKVMVGGKPAVRMNDMTMHNSKNTMGAALMPGAQTVVLAMG